MFPDYVVQIKSQKLTHVVGYSKLFKGPNFLHLAPTGLNIARESMNRFMTHDRNQWRSLVNMVMYIRVLEGAENFLTK
jgi:hypothetical protein